MKNMLLVSVLILFAGTLFAQTATTPTGDGSSSNPYQIATLNNLYWVTQNSSSWKSYFIQTEDIDATTSSSWNNGSGFSPIGNGVTQFNGSYNGQAHKIIGLFISSSSAYFVGLFGFISYATIINVKLDTVKITGYCYVGGLIGEQDHSTVTNCYSLGSVTGYGDYVGGLIGNQWDTSIVTNCYSISSVTGYGGVGGLIGHQERYSIATNCCSSGSVTGSGQYVGGLIGFQYDNSTTANCYSTDTVKGSNQYVGGLIGYQYLYSNVTNCYSTGTVKGTNYAVGGLIGAQYSYSTATNCYSSGFVIGYDAVGGLIGTQSYSTSINCFWDTSSSCQTSSAGGIGKSTAEMKTQSLFINAGWDFTNVWSIDSNTNNGYPYLTSNIPTSVEVVANVLPKTFSLLQNYPNPFNPTTTIQFSVEKSERAIVKVFDLLGREVATLYDAIAQSGKNYIVTFNGSRFSTGVYFYSIETNNQNIVKKMVMLK